MIGKNPAVTGVALALGGFALFALHDAILKFMGDDYTIFQIIFFATMFSFLPMTLAMISDRAVDNFRLHNPGLVFVRAALMVVSMTCAFFAFTRLPLTETYAVLFATPLLVTVFAIPMLGEVVRLQRWIAIVVGLGGVIVVLRPGAQAFEPGHLAAIAAACSSALSAIIIRKIGTGERSAVLIVYPMFATIIVMAVLMPVGYRPVELPHLGLLATMGTISVVAQFLIVLAYRSAPAAIVAPTQYSQILWATFFGFFLFGEKIDTATAVGSAMVILSGVFIVWRESRTSVSSRMPVLRTINPRFDTGPSPEPKDQPRD